MTDCAFCEIVAAEAPATVLRRWPDAIAVRPLNPVTEGHALVIPHAHVETAADDPLTTGLTFARAAGYASSLACDANLITSIGPEATQSVFHLHVHVVPRTEGDGLRLPWTRGGKFDE